MGFEVETPIPTVKSALGNRPNAVKLHRIALLYPVRKKVVSQDSGNAEFEGTSLMAVISNAIFALSQ